MESITGRPPFLAAVTRRPTAVGRNGFLGGAGLLAALVAVDVLAGKDAAVVGAFVLAPFIPAILGTVPATVMISLFTVAAAAASSAWNANFGADDYWVRNAEVAVGAVFAVLAARARWHARLSSQRLATLDAVAAISDGSLPLSETLERVLQAIVPAAADISMIDAIRDGRVVRAAVRASGRPDAKRIEEGLRKRNPSLPRRFVKAERAWMQIAHFRRRVDAEDLRRMAEGPQDLMFLESLGLRSLVVASLTARGRSLGTLTLATAWSRRGYTNDDVRFAQLLARRIGMALDNAGLFSDLESIERRLDAVVSLLDEAVVVHDAGGELVYANEAASTWLGYRSPEDLLDAPRDEVAGRLDLWSEDGTKLDPRAIAWRFVRHDLPDHELFRIALPGPREERWVVVNSEAIDAPDGSLLYTVTTVDDVTNLKRSEFAQQLLARTGELLASSNDYRETVHAATRVAVPGFAGLCSVHLLNEQGRWQREAVAHDDPAKLVVADRLVSPEVLEQAAADSEHVRAVRAEGVGTAIVAPMTAGATVVGALAFVNGPDARPFDDRDRVVATEIARRTGLAVANARLAGEQAHVAGTLQRGLLPPRPPEMNGFEVATMYRPAGEVNEVGGDFYEAFEIDGGWMVTIGDVMGRGAAAASLTALARYTIRTAGKLTGDPRAAAALVDHALKEAGDILLCSAVIVVLPDTDDDPTPIRLLVAGHPPPLRVRGGEIEPVGISGPLLGAPTEPRWEISNVELAQGDQLVLYTDGVTEARGAEDRFGEERLRAQLAGAGSPAAIVASVESALESFLAGNPEDDAAVLAIRRTERPVAGVDPPSDVRAATAAGTAG